MKDKDMWQTCPVCAGTGIGRYAPMAANLASPKCKVCNGRRIISILTGEPPARRVTDGQPQQ